ncbi:IclR family transcriptional regulator [Amycolatopsis acidiphila]|uniref:Glycerol operon regulatory protein n=1 Tax=Amycolatopsis acidiphila TaxID=715473 RepID=A0A558ABS2_9PSEU|nr:IclR family transcriptional regulator [Amycolatopsis acidiphila]TVT21710.1 IclR family transcriptional regulator [Amycolatopsis acidiphila]UIJ59751.1 IclR family transcriptional regulator [Amycolatopsis acidiphila]GHG98511.1 IclR family transcriptional regulator [Amycolatopsis acidiphila]
MVENAGECAGGLRSVLTALDLLDCFTAEKELGVSELARRLGVAKSTAHRLLTTLCARGFIQRNTETGQYRLGLRLHELGLLAISRYDLRRAAMPLLEELRERTGNTVHLGVVVGADVIHLERLETLRGMRLFRDVARRLPVHSTACGKAIAAFDPVCASARISAGFPAFTPSTIRTAEDFERELGRVRQLNFATNHDEVRSGLTSVACPVRDHAGHAYAAISIVAPTPDAERNVGRYARLATITAAKVTHIVGV